VVFSKGGYASVPVVLAARVLGIPVIIHESDAKPGRANLMASSFAYRIAVAFESAAAFFPAKVRGRIARTGIPIRSAIAHPETENAREELGLDTSIPTILILGGSSGAKTINEVVVSALPELVESVNIIHQTGRELFKGVEGTAKLVLEKSANAARYHPFPYLNSLSTRRALALPHDVAVVGEPEPFQTVDDIFFVFARTTFAVRVFNTKKKLPAVFARE
jgi:UDP-N-acetylglucosamine--N-acetylmuramyl-(pentapeptide) pyrophosphoryl-undecaprenol N-acetylglucosamine transferase